MFVLLFLMCMCVWMLKCANVRVCESTCMWMCVPVLCVQVHNVGIYVLPLEKVWAVHQCTPETGLFLEGGQHSACHVFKLESFSSTSGDVAQLLFCLSSHLLGPPRFTFSGPPSHEAPQPERMVGDLDAMWRHRRWMKYSICVLYVQIIYCVISFYSFLV